MSDNSYNSPDRMSDQEFISGGGADPREVAKAKLATPAIALLIVGILSVLASLWGVGSALYNRANADAFTAQFDEVREQIGEDNPFIPVIDLMISANAGPWLVITNIVGLLVSLLIVAGALRMKSQKSYALSVVAAIMAMLPIGSCCCIGLPIGIWALIVLMNGDVKQSFG